MSSRMNKKVARPVTGLLLAALAGLSSMSVYAEDEVLSRMSVQQRIERIERLLGADVLQQQMHQLEVIQQEISLLREQIEQQGYELDTIKQRQRSLYLDMDRRLSNLEAGGGGGSRSSGVVPPVPAASRSGSVSAPASGAASGDEDGKDDYAAAFALLKEGRYQPSIEAFSAFLKKYPQSKFSDNAQYWLGEANYVSRDYKQALEEFQRLIARYPESTKIPGARLKIGYVYFELKNWSAARENLQLVIKLYPDASVAGKAKERLDRMQREGH